MPLFGICGTIMQPVSYTLSGDEDPNNFQLSTFEIGSRENLHILANDTMQRLAPLASSSPDAGIKSARCFQYNFLKLLFQQQQYTALDLFLRYELYKKTAIKFKADAWNPCIVYAAPHALVDHGRRYAAAVISTLNLWFCAIAIGISIFGLLFRGR